MGKYKIKQGDTLSGVASKYGVSVNDLAKTNGISNPNLITTGAILIVPDPVGKGGSSSSKKEENTGWNGYTKYEADPFQKSQNTLDAEGKKQDANAAYDTHVNTGVQSEYKGLADEILKGYMNREDFSYDFNTDALYQQYKDKYIKQGKMAMQDTIGQASAMTGGYGNSYAASVGNQAYQASLENLNDVIPELYQMAYDRYNQKGQDMLNQYSLASDAYGRDYNEYMDKLGILDSNRNYWGTEANNLYNRDWGQYEFGTSLGQSEHQTEQGYLYQGHRDKIEDDQWQTSFEEGQRQYNEQMALNREQFNWQMEQANKSTSSGGSSSGGSSSGSGGGTSTSGGNSNETPTAPKATSTLMTTDFINSRSDKNRYLQSGKTLADWKKYIEREIEQWDKLMGFTDEELAYLVQYYGLE